MWEVCFFFQAEDGIRYLVRSRGLGDVYKRQELFYVQNWSFWLDIKILFKTVLVVINKSGAR